MNTFLLMGKDKQAKSKQKLMVWNRFFEVSLVMYLQCTLTIARLHFIIVLNCQIQNITKLYAAGNM